MEQLKDSLFSELRVPVNAHLALGDKTLLVTIWNWDYDEFLSFQKQAQELIQKHRDHKIFIFCNHPHCFTLGRGNERGREDLIGHDESITKDLKYPLFKIHRGGGITFHYPGQWIFYSIVSINAKYTLEDHMCFKLKGVKEVLQSSFGLSEVMATKKLMGVWYKRKKLASIGVGLNRFVTEHGLALNITYDEKMFNELKKINPCGMDSQVYQSLDQLVPKESNLLEKFDLEFKKRFFL